MGIDPGTSTISAVSDTDVFLEELAKDAAKYEKKIFPLQQSMDRSKRMMNPQNYHEDGTIKKGKKTWKYIGCISKREISSRHSIERNLP